MKEKAKIEEAKKDTKGIPEFWLTIFKNVDMLQEMVQDHDEPALATLEDITVTFSEKPMVRETHAFSLDGFLSISGCFRALRCISTSPPTTTSRTQY